MVSRRDQDWRALQCKVWSRGLCWAGMELPSSGQEVLKMPSRQVRHEIKSWERDGSEVRWPGSLKLTCSPWGITWLAQKQPVS